MWIKVSVVVVGIIILGIAGAYHRPAEPSYGTAGDYIADDVVPNIPSKVVFIVNESDYGFAPGVFVVHSPEFSLNFVGQVAPPAFEKLAEIGIPGDAIDYVTGMDGVYDVKVSSEGHIDPGEKFEIAIGDYPKDAVVSVMTMVVETNDAVAFIDSSPLYDEFGLLTNNEYFSIIDLGTEENTPLRSGFEGGQPEAGYGAANVENGTATEDVVIYHPQFPGADADILLYEQY